MANQQTQYIPENVFVQLGLSNLSLEEQEAFLEKMNELVQKRLLVRILETVPEAVQQEVAAMQFTTPEESMQELMKHVPYFGDMLEEEVENVKNELRASMQTAA